MPRLVPNPLGDIMQPLQRIEAAIKHLTTRLHPGDEGPSVQEELGNVNRALDRILLVLEEIRDEQVATSAKRPAA
jgi:hypothetical protein